MEANVTLSQEIYNSLLAFPRRQGVDTVLVQYNYNAINKVQFVSHEGEEAIDKNEYGLVALFRITYKNAAA